MSGLEETFALGPFRVDLAATRLSRDAVELELRPRAFRVLKVLIQNPGRLVDYDQMIREAWDGVHVANHTVAVTVAEIKSVLGEYGTWINCQPKFGYRLEIPKSEDLIRRGWHYWNQYTRAGFENALLCFQQAGETDSADFRAFEGISSTYLMMASFVMRAPRDVHAAFLEAHSRAVALCGLTPELRLDRAYAHFVFDQRLPEAEAELLAVQRERPHSAVVHIRLAMVYLASGRLAEARAILLPAQESGALLPPQAFVGTLLRLYCREFSAAAEWGKDTMDLHPSSQIGRAHYADALDFSGRGEEAVVQYRLASAMSPDTSWIRAAEACCLARNGYRTDASAILESLRRFRETEYVDAYLLALVLDALGRRDEAFRELERAYQEKAYTLLFVDVDAKADGLRADPRFARVRSRTLGHAQTA